MRYRPLKTTDAHHACGHDHAPGNGTPPDHHDHARHDHGSACCAADSLQMPGPEDAKPGRADIPAGCTLTRLRIVQMDCPTEEALLRKKLAGMGAVKDLDFNLMQRVLSVVHDSDALGAVEAAIRDLGMHPEAIDSAAHTAFSKPAAKPWWPLALAGTAALGAEIVHWLGLPEWLAALLALLAISIGGIATYQKGWIALRHGNLNINALMSIAVTGAVILRQWSWSCSRWPS